MGFVFFSIRNYCMSVHEFFLISLLISYLFEMFEIFRSK